jgi:hypothetical protein
MNHQHDHGDTMGGHGMLLFGDEPLYLSHLPLFGHPGLGQVHHFQAFFEVALDRAALATLRADRASGAGQHTFLPADFSLAELDPDTDGPQRTSMDGVIFRGHFERGGTPITGTITVDVRRVVRFTELDSEAKPVPGRELSYLCFGRAGTLHLAHEITARPSFDQVLTARLVPGTVTNMLGTVLPDDAATIGFDLAEPVGFTRLDRAKERLTPGDVVTGTFHQAAPPSGAHGFTVQVAVQRELYLEITELA